MFVKDGDGTLIDFVWPSFWYLAKAGFAVSVGVFVASLMFVLLAMPFYYALMRAMLGVYLR